MAIKDRDKLASLNIKDGYSPNLGSASDQLSIWTVCHAHDKFVPFMLVLSLQEEQKSSWCLQTPVAHIVPAGHILQRTTGSRYERSSSPSLVLVPHSVILLLLPPAAATTGSAEFG